MLGLPLSILCNLVLLERLQPRPLITALTLLVASVALLGALPYAGLAEGLAPVLPDLLSSAHRNAGRVATITDTDDSMWLHMLSMTGPSARVRGSGLDVAFVTWTRRVIANAMIIVPREKIMARPHFCRAETWSLRRRLRGRIMMKMSAITSALVANLIEMSALRRSSGSLQPALRVSMGRSGKSKSYVLTRTPVFGKGPASQEI
jgi:hypothetical protein